MSEGHVVLVGLMGSGKSTVGRRLAARLDRPFVDADDELEARAGRPIAELFDVDGEQAFREQEAALLDELLARPDPVVLASGGGVVVAPRNREQLGRPGVTVVWLDASPAFLASRAKPKPHRPLLHGPEAPRTVFERLHAQRAPLYREVADVVVDVEPFHRESDSPKRALAERLAALVLEHEGSRA